MRASIPALDFMVFNCSIRRFVPNVFSVAVQAQAPTPGNVIHNLYYPNAPFVPPAHTSRLLLLNRAPFDQETSHNRRASQRDSKVPSMSQAPIDTT